MPNIDKQLSLMERTVPLFVFFALLVYGLFLQPMLFKGPMLSLEVLILIAISFSSIYLMFKGFSWKSIEQAITKKVGESIPIVLILFSIGVLIGSWIVSGTIPMLIYYGISMVSPQWIYLFAFIICILFSLLTGTSWGSAGTIGVVMMGISEVYDANLAITASAVVGGSFFGDKMSPLSDTTNIASLATQVHIFDHIKSMMYTTGPAALIAVAFYGILCFTSDIGGSNLAQVDQVDLTLSTLNQIFNFNIVLLLPLVLVLYGSMTRKPIVLTLLGSAWLAVILAVMFQDFNLQEAILSCKSGFDASFIDFELPEGVEVLNILNRGGLYNLIEGIVVSILIFAFIGTLELVQAIQYSIEHLFRNLRRRSSLVASSLAATLLTNLTTSNQYATSFIIGAAFKEKFDELKVKRKVLSRSIEDAGTMMENLLPWTPSGIFMAQTLGVSTFDYAAWQILSLSNIVIAFFFAFTGIACFYRKTKN